MKESEGNAMKKDIEWLVHTINAERNSLRQRFESGKETADESAFNNGREQALMFVSRLLEHLDEPEVLSQEWIDKNVVHVRGLGDIIEAEVIENLLVPKQAELEVKIQELIEAYEQEDGQYSNPENGWIGGFIEDLKNLLEEQQKYYVLDTEDIPMLVITHGVVNGAYTYLSIHEKGRDTEHYQLTEQEIKEFDDRYWTFAVPVEELAE